MLFRDVCNFRVMASSPMVRLWRMAIWWWGDALVEGSPFTATPPDGFGPSFQYWKDSSP